MSLQTFKSPVFLAYWLGAWLAFSAAALHAQSAPHPEKAKIEALIKRVSELQDAKFVRNGAVYDVTAAVRFLRGKWRANDKEV